MTGLRAHCVMIRLKHILSIKSSSKEGWLSLKLLTESIDRYIAARSNENSKTQVHAIGQSVPRSPKPQCKNQITSARAQQIKPPAPEKPKQWVNQDKSNTGPGKNRQIMTTPSWPIHCFGCGEIGHIQSFAQN